MRKALFGVRNVCRVILSVSGCVCVTILFSLALFRWILLRSRRKKDIKAAYHLMLINIYISIIRKKNALNSQIAKQADEQRSECVSNLTFPLVRCALLTHHPVPRKAMSIFRTGGQEQKDYTKAIIAQPPPELETISDSPRDYF